MKQLLNIALFALFVTSCDEELRFALHQSGDNRTELEAVLKHYRDEGDEFKLESAEFLIRNMPFNYTHAGSAIETYDSLVMRTADVSDNKRTAFFNEQLELIDGSNQMAIDIRTVKADYLIRMIDQACDTWRNSHWS